MKAWKSLADKTVPTTFLCYKLRHVAAISQGSASRDPKATSRTSPMGVRILYLEYLRRRGHHYQIRVGKRSPLSPTKVSNDLCHQKYIHLLLESNVNWQTFNIVVFHGVNANKPDRFRVFIKGYRSLRGLAGKVRCSQSEPGKQQQRPSLASTRPKRKNSATSENMYGFGESRWGRDCSHIV